jgi:hypothetical protein
MKKHGGVEVYIHVLLTLALAEDSELYVPSALFPGKYPR